MRILSLTAVLATLLAPHMAFAHEIKHKGLQIVHPWTHESGPSSAASAGISMIIRNHGTAADRLVSASTPRAARDQLVAGARKTFAIAPGQELKLDTKTGYVRLLGLTKTMYAHDNFPLTLIFEKAGRVDVEVQIEEARVQEPHKH